MLNYCLKHQIKELKVVDEAVMTMKSQYLGLLLELIFFESKSLYFLIASAHSLPKVELPQNAIKAIKGSELEAASLPAQVGGTIVHVLGWKEGMAILPGSNLKVSKTYPLFYCISSTNYPNI